MSLAASALELDLAGDVRLAAGGDRAAFARLVETTSGVVCALALAIVRDVPASEDVAQDVFLAAWTGLPRLARPESFLPWIRQVTRFRARSWLRARAARPADAKRGVDPVDHPDDAPTGEDRLLADEERRALDEAFDVISQDAREVITLYYREGASTAQVAELLGLGEAAVRQRLSRARAELRAEVLERLASGLRRTGPGAAFVAAVVAASAAPSTAAAAGLGLAAKSGGLLGGKLLAILGGAGLGLLGGAAGVILRMRPHLREAIDDDERRELTRFGWITVALTAGVAAGYALTGALASAALGVATHVTFVAGMAYQFWVRLPRLTARRDAIRVAADPRFARKLRFRRTWGRVAFVFGVAVATATMLAAYRARGWL